MLTSLIAVLVLLVIGFYALYIGAVGRVGNGEAPLTPPRRLGMMLIGLVALVVAFMVYSHPSSLQSASSAPKSWNAQPASPQQDPGDAATEQAANATAAEGESPTPAAAAETPAGPEPVAEGKPAPKPKSASVETEGGVSAAALAMERELLRRRQRLPGIEGELPMAAEVVAESKPAATLPPPAGSPAPAPATKASRPAATTTSSRRYRAPEPTLGPAQPLTIVIHNELGETQQRERLSLLIEGKRVASFEITDAAPVIELPIRLPRPGLLHYRLEGESVQGRRQALSGQGCISAIDGARFQVRRAPGSRRVFLESTRG
ncbi:MAG: hypothetical protein Q8Q73_17425 [Stagnimonas sp.]|nr:hypothetical protein [Stagnimonas sp.]